MTVTEYKLAAGLLEAVFLPGRGMLGVSLRHRGEELLRRLENLEAAAAKGSTAGIPLLYPWANRLAVPRYRAAGREVTLDPSSPLLHLDDQGLLIHGVRWALLAWDVLTAEPDRLVARLDWSRPELLAVFPFSHKVEMAATLCPESLTIETTIMADDPVPASFGFHPYFGLPGLPRAQWRLELPDMRKLVLDDRGIPNGEEQPFELFNGPLGELNLDAGFAVLDERPKFSLTGAGRRITVELLENYRYVQVFAPKSKDFVALEPMTAATNALVNGCGLGLVSPNRRFRAVFRISVEPTSAPACVSSCD
ncbi:MAG TPA: aldose 1-epimerase [Candidatus Hydrogenedentes bacterium]|nr:aldose 1-epimerase [Candidatus Hydrogenedentota bacterium]HQH53738.1 aldose 1-epimerase [Candidatus Hydrogenedentota bacterium]